MIDRLSEEREIRRLLYSGLDSWNNQRDKAKEMILEAGERMVEFSLPLFSYDELVKLTDALIRSYDFQSCYVSDDNRLQRAANAVGKLGCTYDFICDMLIENAKEYARVLHIDDADPYNPNSFDALAIIPKKKVITFLEDTVTNDWGLPRWQALESLCDTGEKANPFLKSIIKGKYQPSHVFGYSINIIRGKKGAEFIEAALNE